MTLEELYKSKVYYLGSDRGEHIDFKISEIDIKSLVEDDKDAFWLNHEISDDKTGYLNYILDWDGDEPDPNESLLLSWISIT